MRTKALEAPFQIKAPDPYTPKQMEDRLRHARGTVHDQFRYIYLLLTKTAVWSRCVTQLKVTKNNFNDFLSVNLNRKNR